MANTVLNENIIKYNSILESIDEAYFVIDLPGKREWPPLLYAAGNGQVNVVSFLLDKGAKLHTDALRFAVSSGSIPTVELLLAHGVDVNAKSLSSEETYLFTAAWNGDAKMVKYLISKGADVTAKSYGSVSALKAAKRGGNEEVVRILKEALAQRNKKMLHPEKPQS